MRPQAVIWSRLDRDTDTLGLGLLRESDGLVDVGPGEARKGVVKLSDEGVSIGFRHGHECPSHDAAKANEDVLESQSRLETKRKPRERT
jgi:hypothetical protein